MKPFPPEPCGRCGHDVNDHEYDEENEMAHCCLMCDCDGFTTDRGHWKSMRQETEGFNDLEGER